MAIKRETGIRTTLSVDQRVKDVVVPRMDKPIFAGMQNVDRVILAMAMGFKHGLKPELSSRNDGGFVRVEYFTPRYKALAHAMRFAESGFDDPDALQDENGTFDLIERFANGGFQLIEGDLDENASSDEIADAFVCDMDELYKQYTGEPI